MGYTSVPVRAIIGPAVDTVKRKSDRRHRAANAVTDTQRAQFVFHDGPLTPDLRRLYRALFVASGAAALVYEVLWVRLFADVFGATAEAAAATLTGVFLGLALGSDLFGRLADRVRRPLRLYAGLELAIPAAAIIVWPLLALYRNVYSSLYTALSGSTPLFTGVRAALAALAVVPAAALMGGTLPALGRGLISDPDRLGSEAAPLYALNVAGAVAGAVAAAFVLPLWLGVRGTYLLAMAVNLAVGGIAFSAARRAPAARPVPAPPGKESGPPHQPGGRRLLAVAFGSGFATLGLQLLWTRMLALVLQNSVYSFGAIVAVFLVGLAFGAAAAGRLLRRVDPWRLLRASLLATAPLIALTPALLRAQTHGLQLYGATGGWISYGARVVGLTSIVILPAVVAAGFALPCVWALWRERPGAGTRLGRPGAVNTIGAVVGPLVAEFVTLPLLGLGTSIGIFALIYLAMGELVPPPGRRPRWGGWERAAVLPALVGIWLIIPPSRLPLVSRAPGEEVLWAEEGARGAVAVVEREGDRRLKLDNHYALGGSAVTVEERRHGHLPLLLHPDPRDVAFIGLGTGITAGAALSHPGVAHVVVMELVPQVVEAARRFFRPWNEGVLDDPRVTVVTEDGRVHLAGTDQKFDVIVGDLFVPWHAGVGALYTREHFRRVRAHLRDGGIFAQWLPLWQLSRREFDIIASTYLSVFPHATLWRGVFSADRPSLALIARADGAAFDLGDLPRRLQALAARDPFNDGFLGDPTGFMVLYAGELDVARAAVAAPLNTIDRPRIEWLAPRTQLAVDAGTAGWFRGAALADFFDALDAALGSTDDRLIRSTPRPPRTYRVAGARFYRATVLAARGRAADAERLRQEAYGLLPGSQ